MSDFMDLVHFIQRNSTPFVMLSFSLIALWAYWPSNRKTLEQQGRIPLDDDR
ncbi:MAG TPA: cbb3-type cytochrome c oxidase subunit 3 [Aliidongia sp.]|nr:cbb3-type cytochrome c oxidase subunit 3 [Aliidongia sp.]